MVTVYKYSSGFSGRYLSGDSFRDVAGSAAYFKWKWTRCQQCR